MAGRLFRHDEPVRGGTIRQLYEPRAIRELAEVLSSYEENGADQTWNGILGPDGQPLSPDSPLLAELVTDVRIATDHLIRRLASRPELLHTLTPRQFEEVVAELLERQGYSITLTPATHDGGVDIFASKRDALDSFLYVVECKKYSASNHVGVGLVRELLGVVATHRATAGVLATTSLFTSGAIELQQAMRWQLALKDYLDVSAWLRAEKLDST
jgi:restriction system protein